MCEALGNPPCGRNPPPIWLPKWEEGVKAKAPAVVRGETYSVGASNSTQTSAAQDTLLAARSQSLAPAAFIGSTGGLASILRPPGGFHAQNSRNCRWNNRSGRDNRCWCELRQRQHCPDEQDLCCQPVAGERSAGQDNNGNWCRDLLGSRN